MSLVIRFAKCKKYLNELNMSHGTFWEDAKLTFDITLMKKVIEYLCKLTRPSQQKILHGKKMSSLEIISKSIAIDGLEKTYFISWKVILF